MNPAPQMAGVPSASKCCECQQTLPRDHFSKTQLSRAAAARKCLACVEKLSRAEAASAADKLSRASATAATASVCCECGQRKARVHFSAAQLAKKADARRCSGCIVTCRDCGSAKPASCYSTAQKGRRLGERRCKACVDAAVTPGVATAAPTCTSARTSAQAHTSTTGGATGINAKMHLIMLAVLTSPRAHFNLVQHTGDKGVGKRWDQLEKQCNKARKKLLADPTASLLHLAETLPQASALSLPVVVGAITRIALDVFGKGAQLILVGSAKHGTAVDDSDRDYRLETRDPVTRGKRAEFVKRCRADAELGPRYPGDGGIRAKTNSIAFEAGAAGKGDNPDLDIVPTNVGLVPCPLHPVKRCNRAGGCTAPLAVCAGKRARARPRRQPFTRRAKQVLRRRVHAAVP